MGLLDGDSPHTVTGELGFLGDMDVRPRFHANDQSRDVLVLAPQAVAITDARTSQAPFSLDVEGFRLVPHRSRVDDFRDSGEIERLYVDEIRELLLETSGADHVTVNGLGVLRFSERSSDSGALDNSRPARFVHIDCSDSAAEGFYRASAPAAERPIRRSAQYNVWRVISPPPQDVPLAVCDARSLRAGDLEPADAVFDRDGQVAFSFESLLVRYSPDQRWFYFSDMSRDEALIFKTHDTDPAKAHQVAHGAFDDPRSAPDTGPRASIEMRGIAYWFE
jgi:hypothetical protein